MPLSVALGTIVTLLKVFRLSIDVIERSPQWRFVKNCLCCSFFAGFGLYLNVVLAGQLLGVTNIGQCVLLIIESL